jgi:hypothetical protein
LEYSHRRHPRHAIPVPSREGWLTEEQILEVMSLYDKNSGYEGADIHALGNMALSALRPAGDEGVLDAWGKALAQQDVVMTIYNDAGAKTYARLLHALPAAPKSPADGGV